MHDEPLNETLFFRLRHVRSIPTRRVDDHSTEQPHSSLGCATPAAYAAQVEEQQADLTPPVASPVRLSRRRRSWADIPKLPPGCAGGRRTDLLQTQKIPLGLSTCGLCMVAGKRTNRVRHSLFVPV